MPSRSQAARSSLCCLTEASSTFRAIPYSQGAAEPFHPGERWTPELALPFVIGRSYFPEDFMASEVDRYLGLPGQAISYKVGEREWLAARDDARSAAGSDFDLKAFHAVALDLGPMGLAQLRRELASA